MTSHALGGDGSRIGAVVAQKYRLEQLLGEGGVGQVYRAQNVLLGRAVAIKLLRREYLQNQDLINRFLREARAANLVRHPNVVDVLDVGLDADGTPYIVQELLQGEDLSQYLMRGAMAVETAVSLLLPVIDAVAFAHVMGVVHRDLKPDNVYLVTVEGGVVPKVLDFGISKIASRVEDVRITSTGISMGTPGYMSPEQIQRFGDIDARADVWALGVILYEMVTGELPFRGETSGAMFVEICTKDPIPLETFLPDASEDLARVIMRCLRREPDERYPTAAELARDLRNMRDGRAIEPTRKIALVSLPPPAAIDSDELAFGQLPPDEPSGPRKTRSTGSKRKSGGVRTPVGRPVGDEPRATADTTVRTGRRTPGAGSAVATPVVSRDAPTDPEVVPPVDPVAVPFARRPMVLGVVAAALLMAGLAWMLARYTHDAGGPVMQMTSASLGPSAATPRAAPVLHIESVPSGATVNEGDRAVGTTPLAVPLDPDGTAPRQFTVGMHGRLPYVVNQEPTRQDVRVVAVLAPAPEAPAVPSVPQLPAGTNVDEGASAHRAGRHGDAHGAHARQGGDAHDAHGAHGPATTNITTPTPNTGPNLDIRTQR